MKQEVEGLVEGLCQLVIRRDPHAAAHLNATSELAKRMACEMRLPEGVVFQVSVAGRLHDLGMLAVPAQIMLKQGPPDQHERDELEMHPIYGASILEGFPALRRFAQIVRTHHERADGKGYPNGLAGDEIPIEAKIVAVAEAYHSMMTDRPFAAARSSQEALAELYRCSDTQFDAGIVNMLCAVVPDASAGRQATLETS